MSAPGHVDAGWLAGRLAADNARELGRGLTQLIDGGELSPGTQLPTIRDFARAAGVSPGTVMAAWSRVRDTGRLETRRRGGTVVAGAAPVTRNRADFGWPQVEMSLVTPDPAVQPDLRAAIVAALGTGDLHAAQRAYITPELLRAVQPGWPFVAQSWNCVGGGSEALVLASAAAAGGVEVDAGGLIAVEEPVSPGYLDILRHLGIGAVGVRADTEGPTVDSVAAAVRAGASAVVLQPSGAYAVTGGLTPARAAELAELLRAHPGVWVIEDDSAGPLAATEPATLGTWLPDQVVRIRSYCKAFGIDLRSAVLGGSGELVERTVRLRSFGMASNSRILQNALADLIEDDAVADQMARARAVYGRRRQAALTAFAAVGLPATSGDNGFVVWVPVPDETSALINLARQGIVVAAGAKSFVSTSTGLLRVSILQLPDDDELIGDLARAVRAAIHSADREYFD
ncbi:MAG: aminotransferase class I/II-fold pyridoxal phosphate-dependent enzyme [Mycolicibacterium neoaurum]|uniref:aminotransferase class I/II-fold pyridoxal phosphate-dependent enzyme n=1 Tax=Mycolicibacterium neoaurum TaxID=1795 RepID=UPI002FF67578